MTNLPPSPYQGVLNLNASAIIEAPIEKVWDLLTNFQSYSEWNTFVHEQRIVDGKTKKPLPDQTPHEGAYLLMEVHIPPTEDRKHKPTSRPLEKITAVDHDVPHGRGQAPINTTVCFVIPTRARDTLARYPTNLPA